MIQTHKENFIETKPKAKLTTKTLAFNPSFHTEFKLSELLTSQAKPLGANEVSESQPEPKKALKKNKLNLKSAMFSINNAENSTNSGTTEPDQNIIRESQDDSIKEPTIDNSNKENSEEEMPPQISPNPEEQKSIVHQKPVNEVQIEITVWMTRAQFAEAVLNLSKTLKDKNIQALEEYKSREIITEEVPEVIQKHRYFNKYQNKKPKDENQVKADLKIVRETVIREPQKEGFIQRNELTEEERAWKEKLSSSAAKTWLKGKQADVDPEEALKKEIKFNLNLLTAENFEKIKEVILKIASKGIANCEKVAEFLVENAWTQKKYINTYARLCAYLGKQENLEFNNGKNYFKLQVLRHIQTVFEDESEIRQETNDERADQAALNKKRMQKIIGNICFIGELFLEKFLPLAVVRIVTSSFLTKFIGQYEKFKKSDQGERLHEETLEGLIKFYDIIGKALEEKEASMKNKTKKNNKAGDFIACFKKTLVGINSETKSSEFIVDDEEISAGIVFKMLDIILQEVELTSRLDSLVKNLKYRRDNGWITSLTAQQGPKTIKELHQEYEKERIEEEKRGEEYRQELKASYNHYKPSHKKDSNNKNGSIFQVATGVKEGKNSVQEKDAAASLSIDVKPGMFGRPMRPGKNNQQNSPGATAKSRISQEEIERGLKEIYRIVNNKESDGVEELENLIKKAGSQDVLAVYLRTFFDGRIEAVKERYFIHNILFETVKKEEFLKMFMKRAQKLYEISCDYPALDKNFAVVLLDFCRRAGSEDVIDGVSFDEGFYENEEAEFILEFYQDMVRQIKIALDGDYQDLKKKIGIEGIRRLGKRVRIDDFDSL